MVEGGGGGEKVGAVREGLEVGGGGSGLGARKHRREQSEGSVPGNVACYDGMSGMLESHVSLREKG